ncbi:MAG: hypothetical protein CBE24_02970 [bacterium TMED264]|nr:MAG: hypothetical protein CBE24_02970 [bacterium TMED264]
MEENGNEQLEYYLSSLDELGEILIDADKAHQVGSGILRLTLGTIMASKGAIFLYNEKTDNLTSLSSKGADVKQTFQPPKNLKIELQQHRKNYVLMDDKKKWISGILEEYVKNAKINTILPLFHKDQFLGLLCIGRKFMGQSYTNSDYKILEIISNHLTKALYNYRLIDEVKKKKTELNMKLLELETLFDISVAISSVLDAEELGNEVLWRSVGILNASKGIIFLNNDSSPILQPQVNFNWENDFPLISKNLSIFKNIIEMRKGKILTEEDNNSLQKKLDEKNLIIAPISTKNKSIGFMVLANKETRSGTEPFNSLDLDLLSSLSNQAAVAIENAKLFKDITKEKQFNESILGSIATGVITFDRLGEVDSINAAGLKILKMEKTDIIGNHFLYLFEKDEEILSLINSSENEGKISSEINMSFKTVSEETIINISVAPRMDPEKNMQGLVMAIEDISDVSKVKNTFKRYVSKQVVDEILDNEAKLNLGGEEREATILFTDIRGFTSMSEKMDPKTVVSTLNEYFSEMIDIVFKYNGTLDKIIGDELMIVYGAPLSSKDDTFRAVKTAIEMQLCIKEMNKKRKEKNEAEILVGAGINRGNVVSGNIGSREMMDYTVIGDTVNLGSRLCSAANPGEILVSRSVYDGLKNDFPFKELDPIRVKGKAEKVNIYSIKSIY